MGRSFESYSGPPIFGGNGRGGSISPHFGGFFIIGYWRLDRGQW